MLFNLLETHSRETRQDTAEAQAMSLSGRHRLIYNDQTMLCHAFSSHSSHFLLIFQLYIQVGSFAITIPSQTPVGMHNQNKQMTGNSSTDLSTGEKPVSEIFQHADKKSDAKLLAVFLK